MNPASDRQILSELHSRAINGIILSVCEKKAQNGAQFDLDNPRVFGNQGTHYYHLVECALLLTLTLTSSIHLWASLGVVHNKTVF